MTLTSFTKRVLTSAGGLLCASILLMKQSASALSTNYREWVNHATQKMQGVQAPISATQ